MGCLEIKLIGLVIYVSFYIIVYIFSINMFFCYNRIYVIFEFRSMLEKGGYFFVLGYVNIRLGEFSSCGFYLIVCG